MTFQRVLYDKTGLVTLTTRQSQGTRPTRPSSCRAGRPAPTCWADAIVLGVSVVLVYLAMVVFGRLAGNFAEEL